METNKSKWVLILIGLDKVLKALGLLFIAIQAHRLLHRDIAVTIQDWIKAVRVDPDNVHLHRFIHKLTGVNRRQLQAVSLGSFIYAGLFLIEGVGLVMRRVWAEYLTVVSTALLLPMELYEILYGHGHLAAKFIVTAINVAILIYLIVALRKHYKTQHPATAQPPVAPMRDAPLHQNQMLDVGGER